MRVSTTPSSCGPIWRPILVSSRFFVPQLICVENGGGGEVRGRRGALGVSGGSCEGAQCPSVCGDGRLVMSWLARPKAHWACKGVTWLGHRGVSPALFWWIRLWRGAAAKETQPANHSVMFISFKLSQLFLALLDSLQCRFGIGRHATKGPKLESNCGNSLKA